MPVTTDIVRTEGPIEAPTSVVNRWTRLLLALAGVELIVLFAPTVVWLFDRWTMSVWQNAHGMFVPVLSAWLSWQELKRRPDLPVRASAWGFVFLVPALAVHAIDAGMHTQLLSAVALFLAVPGLSLLLLGTEKTRLIAFPIAFLAFALPIPLAFTEPLHMALRHVAAGITAAALPIFGVSVFLEGTTLHTTAGIVSVGDACSGFSTLYASVTFAGILAYLAASWRRGLLVCAASVPIAILANLLRVIALTLMVAWGEGWLLDTFVHPLSGILTFALALPILLWLSERKGAIAQP
jgi:exosortase